MAITTKEMWCTWFGMGCDEVQVSTRCLGKYQTTVFAINITARRGKQHCVTLCGFCNNPYTFHNWSGEVCLIDKLIPHKWMSEEHMWIKQIYGFEVFFYRVCLSITLYETHVVGGGKKVIIILIETTTETKREKNGWRVRYPQTEADAPVLHPLPPVEYVIRESTPIKNTFSHMINICYVCVKYVWVYKWWHAQVIYENGIRASVGRGCGMLSFFL